MDHSRLNDPLITRRRLQDGNVGEVAAQEFDDATTVGHSAPRIPVDIPCLIYLVVNADEDAPAWLKEGLYFFGDGRVLL